MKLKRPRSSASEWLNDACSIASLENPLPCLMLPLFALFCTSENCENICDDSEPLYDHTDGIDQSFLAREQWPLANFDDIGQKLLADRHCR